MESLKQFAVVTGASSGIGYELAKQFAQNGFDLLVTAEDAGIAEAAQAFEAWGANVRTVQVDLSSYEGVEKLYSAIKAYGRPVDAVALNAGVGVHGPFSETDLMDELNLINLNVVSVVHLSKRLIKDMITAGHGRILYTASIASTMPAPFMAVYAASKAFVLSFSEALRSELKDSGITVTALMPGPTDTEFFERADMMDTKAAEESKKTTAAEVAQEGFEALMAGSDHIIAGNMKTKIQGAMAKIIPEAKKAEQHRKMTEPGSARK